MKNIFVQVFLLLTYSKNLTLKTAIITVTKNIKYVQAKNNKYWDN